MGKGAYYRPGMSETERERYREYRRNHWKQMREKAGFAPRINKAIEGNTQLTEQPLAKPHITEEEVAARLGVSHAQFEEYRRKAMEEVDTDLRAKDVARTNELLAMRPAETGGSAPVKKDQPPWETTDMISVERVAEDVTYQNAPNEQFAYAVRMAYVHIPKDKWTTKDSTKRVLEYYKWCKKWHDEHSSNMPTENE